MSTQPLIGTDPELGKVEWLFPDATEEDVQRVNEELQQKLTFMEKQK